MRNALQPSGDYGTTKEAAEKVLGDGVSPAEAGCGSKIKWLSGTTEVVP